MFHSKFFKNLTILFLVLLQFTATTFAQTGKISEPRQQKLLNGLKLLVWNDPQSSKVTVKLRIHNGSAFDPAGKEGVMALLADALFPNEAQKDFFTEDLGGSLDVTSNYDFIQINATANSDQFLTLIETLATAVTKPQLDKPTTAKVIAARLAKVKQLENDPSYIADRAVAKRLFGDYPYGRPPSGTSESLAKIDFADLLFAEQRFLTADNATMTIVGNVKPEFAYSAVRRYFGAWEKADKKVPATFRQPDAPDEKTSTIEMSNAKKDYFRAAQMAVGRNDNDFFTTQILTLARQKQLCWGQEWKSGELKLEPHLLESIYTISLNTEHIDEKPGSRIIDFDPCSFPVIENGKMIYPKIEQVVFNEVKTKIIAELQQKMQLTSDLAELWLDIDTYKLVSVKDEMQKANNVTLQDVQRIAENLQKQPVVSVIVRKSSTAKQ